MNKLIILSLAAVAFMTVSCDSDDNGENTGDNPRYHIPLSADESKLLNKQNEFGFDLFSQLPVEDVTLLSPYSVVQCMSMITNGAAGNTLTELDSVFVAKGYSLSGLNELNKRLNKNLPVLDKTVTLSIANSLWFNNGFDVLPGYKNLCSDFYSSEIRNADLYSSSSVKEINDWIADKTKDLITNMVKDTPNSEQVAVNAVYYNGLWSTPFKSSNTKEADFTNSDGSKSKIKMMSRTNESIIYTETEKLQIATLEYGNGAYQMVIALPKKDQPLTLLNNLDSEMWKEIKRCGNSTPSKITLKLPRFELKDEFSVKEAISALGVNDAFDSKADFSNISSTPTFIGGVLHSVAIKVNESGTEAAAVTGTFMVGSPSYPKQYNGAEMIVDHPFAFMIKETSTGAVLFMGRINRL